LGRYDIYSIENFLFEQNNRPAWRFEISLIGDPVVFYGSPLRRCDDSPTRCCDSLFRSDISERKK